MLLNSLENSSNSWLGRHCNNFELFLSLLAVASNMIRNKYRRQPGFDQNRYRTDFYSIILYSTCAYRLISRYSTTQCCHKFFPHKKAERVLQEIKFFRGEKEKRHDKKTRKFRHNDYSITCTRNITNK